MANIFHEEFAPPHGAVQRMAKTGRKTSLARLFAVAMLSIVMAAGMLAGCGTGSGSAENTNDNKEAKVEDTKPAEANPVVQITMQDGGKIDVELDPAAAPITVENFLKLVNEGFYDGLTFHRIIPGFMIQGGDPEGTGMGGSGTEIKGEFSANGVDNPISHVRGVISMARSQAPDSASSQFFITNADSVFLDGDYAAFGRVTSGMDVVDQISAVETGASDAPVTPVVIESVKQVK
jgi:peptidyl-prolyl cis-trans isomerase B (cyclophilin B)